MNCFKDTVAFDEERGALAIIDQTLLPGREELIYLTSPDDIRGAIYDLKVRGAPAIGVAAAISMYIAAAAIIKKPLPPCNFDEFIIMFRAEKDKMISVRPTAVNLSWALNRMEHTAMSHKSEHLETIVEHLKDECLSILSMDARVCEAIGARGLELLAPGMGIMTHCNAGRLATASKYGTATAPIYMGHERGYDFKVFCGETRPLLQGARLTAYELCSAGIETTLFCDNMAPSLMSAGRIDAILVGCDRVAANGDTANKIGTSYIAIAAKYYGIPFYVCAPTSTIDFTCANGQSIIIEQRKAAEVTDLWFKNRIAPDDVNVYNPSFDVTDAKLITAIITENGIARPPFDKSLLMRI